MTQHKALELDDGSPRVDEYHVCFAVARPLMNSGEAQDYVLNIKGTLEVANGKPSGDIVGWISARLVQAGRALDDHVPLLEVCDSIDQDLYDYASAVYDFGNPRPGSC